MKPAIYFVAGLPRSGSTLLMNLLGQNPNHHVTPTSGVNGLVNGIKNHWMTIDAFKAQGLGDVEDRVAASIRGMLYGFYEEELASGRVVFDKNRGWIQNIELLEKVLRRPVRIICTVRDVRAVIASFEKLHRNSPLSRRAYLGPEFMEAQTIEGRSRVLLGKGGVVGLPINAIRDALGRGVSDRLIIVPYAELTTQPQATLDRVHDRLGLPRFTYDPNNVQQLTQEDDMLYGWGKGLHSVRTKVEPPKENPWASILPPGVCKQIEVEFGDINRLALLRPNS